MLEASQGELVRWDAPQDITHARTYEQFRDRELGARIRTAQKGWEIHHAQTKLFITRIVHCSLKAKDTWMEP